MNAHRRDVRGFTLVEILIVCGILLLLLSVSLPVFSSILRGHRMTGASRSVEGAFLQARGAAIAGRTVWILEVDLLANAIRAYAGGAADVRTTRLESPIRLGRTTPPVRENLSYAVHPDGTIECVDPPDVPSSAYDADPAGNHDFLLLQEGSASRFAFDVVPVTGRVRGRRIE